MKSKQGCLQFPALTSPEDRWQAGTYFVVVVEVFMKLEPKGSHELVKPLVPLLLPSESKAPLTLSFVVSPGPQPMGWCLPQ